MSGATPRSDRRAAGCFVLIGLAILISIVTLSIVYGYGRARKDMSRAIPPKARVLPAVSPAAPPHVIPLEFEDMTPDQARAFNATVPLAPGRILPAPPFHYRGLPEDRARAVGCLAAAVLYEAGDDPTGEAAVAQVVLNRLRHPAFPKTLCGVVLQGSERRTGCQFTFTCDGALDRPRNPVAWARARLIAERALDGRVVAQVGTATHYHADYVVPYWGSSLTKIAVVAPHIFYRWPGRWGLPALFTNPLDPGEPIDRRIAAMEGLAPPGMAFAGDPDALAPSGPLRIVAIPGVPASALRGAIVRLKDDEAGQYVVQLDPAAGPGRFAILGFTICGGRPDCIVMGWTSAEQVPRAFPVMPPAMRTQAFLYRRSSITETARSLWDCRRFPRPVASQCLPGTR